MRGPGLTIQRDVAVVREIGHVGVAEASHWSDPVSAIKAVEAALKAAKQGGRNRTHYHDGCRVQSLMAPAALAC